MVRTELVGLLGIALITGLCGCYYPYDCRELSACRSVCLGDPTQAQPLDDCGVFVSSTLGDDENPGTSGRPVRTLNMAIRLAEAGSRRVYACAETFLEPVEISGVELWGGLDCENGWAYIGETHKTTITPGPDMVPLRVVPGGRPTIVADVHAEAASAVQPSGSAIAAMVMPDAVVEIKRSELIAGDGAAGAAGRPGGTSPAQAGTNGADGANACSADLVAGGPATVMTCGPLTSTGGQGGYGDITQGGNGADGQPEPVPNPNGDGFGGTGSQNGSACIWGADGATGASGADGHGAIGPGQITPSGWQGVPGEDGGDGRPGQGGGGGGGARGGLMVCMILNSPMGGASGGAGASGGCGGRGGQGGAFGGASIGLLALSRDVSVDTTMIVTGRGGDGGAGGLRQDGGAPGVGGNGGQAMQLSNAGCRGGDGGLGGNGGNGGGGLGGPSIGIAFLAHQTPQIHEAVSIQTGAAGKGGPGGNPDVPGSTGQNGITATTQGFPP